MKSDDRCYSSAADVDAYNADRIETGGSPDRNWREPRSKQRAVEKAMANRSQSSPPIWCSQSNVSLPSAWASKINQNSMISHSKMSRLITLTLKMSPCQ